MAEAGNGPKGGKPPAAPTRTNTGEPTLLPPGHVLAGRFRITELIGVGGMGIVYRARDLTLDVDVAIKVLRPELAVKPEAAARFRQEMLSGRSVTHPHVVRLHDLAQDGDLTFLVMDYVPGRSLRTILEEEGPLPVNRAVHLALELAEALAEAHRKGVVHRDLKPENVLVDEAGNAYISDFGVARLAHRGGLTRAGALVGTLEYLSPEQARGEEVDARSDIYALGLLFFEMLSGSLPFPGGSAAEILAQRLSGAPRRLSELGVRVPRHVEAVIRRCLERHPSRRFQSAEELIVALKQKEGPHWPRLLLAVAATLLVASAGYLLFRSPSAPLKPSPPSASAQHTVAVLPFNDETGRPELAWLATEIADALAANLGESPSLAVVPSVRVFRTLADLHLQSAGLGDREVQQLGELFDAHGLVTGRVRVLGDTVVVQPVYWNLQGPVQPTSLPAEEGKASEFPALAARVGEKLRAHIKAAAPPELPPPAAVDVKALAAHARGVQLLAQGDFVAAAPLLEQAVAAAPEFAPAWVALADAYQNLGYLEKAQEAAARAVELVKPSSHRLALEAQAREQLLAGEPARAQKTLEALLARYPYDVEARIWLAEALARQGQLQSAIDRLEEVLRQEPNHPRASFLVAKFLIQSGQARKAVDEHLVRALVIHSKLHNEQGRADVLNAFGVAYQQLGDFAQAAEYYRQAGAIRERIGDRRGMATALKNLAVVEFVRGNMQAAESSLNRSLAVLQEIGDRRGQADLYTAFGGLEEERGNYRQALDHYRHALRLARELQDKLALAEALNNVGYASYLIGLYDDAAVYCQQAAEAFRQSGNAEGELSANQNVALVSLVQGQWEKASRLLLASLEKARALGKRDAIAASLGQLGLLAHYQGRWDAALASYRQALEIVGELEDRRGMVEFTTLRAETLVAVGLREAAQRELETVERWLEENGNREQQAHVFAVKGRVSLGKGETAAARLAFSRALQEAEQAQAVALALDARLGLAQVEAQAGHSASALNLLQQVVTEAERLAHVPLQLQALESLAALQLARNQSKPAEEALRKALRLARECGNYGREFRLHYLLGRALGQRQGEAAAEQKKAAEQLLELRRSLPEELLTAFDRLPEVQEVQGGRGLPLASQNPEKKLNGL